MLWFRFQQNHTINEEFDFGGLGARCAPIAKNRKILLQNGGPNPHRKFYHSSSIIKSVWGGPIPSRGVEGTRFQKFEKLSRNEVQLIQLLILSQIKARIG